MYQRVEFFAILAFAAVLASCATLGEVKKREHEHGTYHLYVPDSYTAESNVVVVVHGTPDPDQDATELARTFIDRWTDFAEETGSVIIAPAFDRQNYASTGGAYGGYRGLYGREVGADEFLHNVLDQVNLIAPTSEDRFYLYGHSAGGQFANRYVVRHPDRVLGVVLSAPGRYAFPVERLYGEKVEWHYGMGSVSKEIKWPNGDRERIDIESDPEGWAQAASRPITIVVGTEDQEPQPCRPAHCARDMTETTRVAIGIKWFRDMGSYAVSEGYTPQMDFELVRGVGHNSAALTEDCQEAMREQMK